MQGPSSKAVLLSALCALRNFVPWDSLLLLDMLFLLFIICKTREISLSENHAKQGQVEMVLKDLNRCREIEMEALVKKGLQHQC